MPDSIERYDRQTVALHWLTAALVVALWSLGQTIDWFAKGDPRIYARSTHITLGAILAVVLVIRIRWRLLPAGGRHLPPAGDGWFDLAAVAVHRILYLLLAATVVLGLLNAWMRGDDLFKLFSIPAFGPADKALRSDIEDWHGLAANTLLIVAFGHACAALFHRFVLRDHVLGRMLPAAGEGADDRRV